MKCITFVIGIALAALLNESTAADRPAGPPVLLRQGDLSVPVDAAALQRQYAALSAMPAVKITYSAQGDVRLLQGDTGIVIGRQALQLKPGELAPEVLSKLGDILLATGQEVLKVDMNMDGGRNDRILTSSQTIRGIPVLHGGASIRLEEATGRILEVGSTFLPDRELPQSPKISAADAAKIALGLIETFGLAKPQTLTVSADPSLAYFGVHPTASKRQLVWVVPVFYEVSTGGEMKNQAFYVDAIDGEYAGSETTSTAALNRAVYSAGQVALDRGQYPTGLSLLFIEGGSSSDDTANTAYSLLGQSAYAWQTQLGYVPSAAIGVVVHYGLNHENAHMSRTGGIYT